MTEDMRNVLVVADGAAIHCALALMTGALASGLWLRNATSAWAQAVARRSQRWWVIGCALGLAADLASLWLQAAVMLDGPRASVLPMLSMVLRETHFGHAWSVGAAALLMALGAFWRPSAANLGIAALAVAVFALSRSAVSHAAVQGDFTVEVGIDWVHLLLVCLWVGIVVIAAFPRREPQSRADRADAASWTSALSRTATAALVFIVLTGAIKVWWATPSSAMLVASAYSRVLFVKLLLVGVAAGLGGFNRFFALPALLRDLGSPGGSTPSPQGRFARVMRLEAAILVGAMVAAAVLSSTATPGEG